MKLSVLLASLVVSADAFAFTGRPALAPHLARAAVRAAEKDEGVSFEFGDAVGEVSSETGAAVQEEEKAELESHATNVFQYRYVLHEGATT